MSEAGFDRTAPTILVMSYADGQEPVAVDVSARVLSLSYEDSEKKADKCTLTVDNFDLTQLDSRHWRTGNKLVVTWGYSGKFSQPREVTITSVKGSTQLKVEASGGAILLHRKTRNRRFENVTVSEAVRAIASENGFGADAQIIDETEVVFETIQQAKQTDAQFLKHLAAREGYEFYVDWQGLHFHAERFGQRPLRSFVYYTGQVGDIETFSIENDITKRPARVRVKGRDPKQKATIDEAADDASTPHEPRLASYGETYITVGQSLGVVPYEG